MNDFSLQILRDQQFFQIGILPYNKEYEYALYIVKNELGENDILKRYWYSNSNEFLFINNENHRNIWFHCFVRNNQKEVIYKKRIKFNYEFLLTKDIHDIDFDEPIDCNIELNYTIPIKYQKDYSSKRHVILLNGALPSNYKRYPLFNRCTWQKKFACSTLNIYDASLGRYSDYLLGWYQGTFDNPLMPSIVKIIERLKVTQGIENKDLVFYGSSAGGWTSLKLAEYFQGATAVAINAQIDILKYSEFSPKAIKTFLNKSFNGLSIDDVKTRYHRELTIDWTKFKGSNQISKSRCILAQNLIDGHHYKQHFQEFWGHFSSDMSTGWDVDKHNYAILYEHSNGHGAEPNEVFNEIMSLLERVD